MAILDAPPDLHPAGRRSSGAWTPPATTPSTRRSTTRGSRSWTRSRSRPIDGAAVGPRGRRLGAHRRRRAACTRRPPTRSCAAPTAWPSRSPTTSRASLNQRRASTASARSPAAASASGARARSRATPSGATSTSAGCSTSSRSRSSRARSGPCSSPTTSASGCACASRSANFLTRVWRDGALFGATPSEAFFVKCDAETNPPDVIDAGQVVVEIGIAPVKPAEFVIFRISQFTAGAAEVEREPARRPRERGGLDACERTAPRKSHFRLDLGGKEASGCSASAPGSTRRPRSSSTCRSTPRASRTCARSPGAHEVVEHHAQARGRREPRAVEVARHGRQGRPRQGAHRRQHPAHRLLRAAHRDLQVRAGLAHQVHGRDAQRAGQRGGRRGDPDLPRGNGAGS